MQKYKHIPAPLRHLASDASQHLPYFKGHDFIIKGSGRPEDWFIGQAHVFEEKDAYDILKLSTASAPRPARSPRRSMTASRT